MTYNREFMVFANCTKSVADKCACIQTHKGSARAYFPTGGYVIYEDLKWKWWPVAIFSIFNETP